jgi:general secretion pathway protein H
LRARGWPDGISADLSIDGHTVAPAPDVDLDAIRQRSTKPVNAAEETEDPAKDPLRPQVMLLSSGEMTPFALDIKAIGVPMYYHFEGDLLGRMSMDRKDYRP